MGELLIFPGEAHSKHQKNRNETAMFKEGHCARILIFTGARYGNHIQQNKKKPVTLAEIKNAIGKKS